MARRDARAGNKTELAACETLAIVDFSALAHRSCPDCTTPSSLENSAKHAPNPPDPAFLQPKKRGGHARDIRSRRGEPEDLGA